MHEEDIDMHEEVIQMKQGQELESAESLDEPPAEKEEGANFISIYSI